MGEVEKGGNVNGKETKEGDGKGRDGEMKLMEIVKERRYKKERQKMREGEEVKHEGGENERGRKERTKRKGRKTI